MLSLRPSFAPIIAGRPPSIVQGRADRHVARGDARPRHRAAGTAPGAPNGPARSRAPFARSCPTWPGRALLSLPMPAWLSIVAGSMVTSGEAPAGPIIAARAAESASAGPVADRRRACAAESAGAGLVVDRRRLDGDERGIVAPCAASAPIVAEPVVPIIVDAVQCALRRPGAELGRGVEFDDACICR